MKRVPTASSSLNGGVAGSGSPPLAAGRSRDEGLSRSLLRAAGVGEAPEEAWRGSLRGASLLPTGTTSGVSGADFWCSHPTLPLSVFVNCGEQGCVIFDHAEEKLNRLVRQPFEATAADFIGTTVCLGQVGGASITRLDWSGEGGGSNWQHFALSVGGVGRRPCVDVCICLAGEAFFGAAENSSFHLFDLTRPETPLASMVSWSLGEHSCCGSGDSSGCVSLLGSSRGQIRLLDRRGSAAAATGAIWKGHQRGSVSAIKWHPHVAHWFVSGSDDGAMKVWDVRSLKSCVAQLNQGHAGGVRALSWSPVHSEIIASIGVDRSLSVWNMRLAPMARQVSYKADFSIHRPLGLGWNNSVILCGDSRGNIAELPLVASFLQPMCPPGEREEAIRRMIYTRDLATAFPLVVERAQMFLANGEVDDALELVEGCYPRTLIAAPLAADNVQEAFERDVLEASSFLPPGFPMPAQANSALRSLKKLRMLLVLRQMYQKQMWREALDYTDELCNFLSKSSSKPSSSKRDPLELSPDLLKDVVVMVLRHHCLSGLTMGAKILRALKEEDFPRHGVLTRALLSPTVFDGFAGGMAQSGTDLDYVLNSQKVGLSQVDFVRDFTARMWNETAWSKVEKMMRKTEHMLVSVCATVNRVYLGFLMQTEQFGRFFLVAAVIAQAAPSCEFSGSILPHIVKSGARMALEWGRSILAAMEKEFSLTEARTLSKMCTALAVRVPAMLSSQDVAEATRLLKALVKFVPPDADAVSALKQEVQDVTALGVLGNEDSIKLFVTSLSLRL